MAAPVKASLGIAAVIGVLAAGTAYGRDLNFYVPDTLPETEEKAPGDVEVLYNLTETSKGEKETTKSVTEKTEPDSDRDSVEEYVVPKFKMPDIPKPKPRKPPAIDAVIRSTRRTESIDPPLDPFGLAAAFKQRWDFSSFVISAKEELRFRLNAARARTQRLARAFSALSDEVATRQRNLNTAALAVYLLSRDQQAWHPVEGRSLTQAQLLAVRNTMRQDISAMNSALKDYETLRDAVNVSTEEAEALDKKGLPEKRWAESRYAVTEPMGEASARMTESVLQERTVSIEALKAALATEMLRENAARRQSIASYAPPPPGASEFNYKVTSHPPTSPSADVLKNQPAGEKMAQPERSSTLVVETKINAPIFAAKQGVVAYAGPFRGHGNMVILEHEKGLFSVYSYMANIQVRERQAVTSGAMLGRAGNLPEMGRSGIHFQVRQGKVAVKPETWLGTDQVAKMLTAATGS